jgi:hypothetical protein
MVEINVNAVLREKQIMDEYIEYVEGRIYQIHEWGKNIAMKGADIVFLTFDEWKKERGL